MRWAHCCGKLWSVDLLRERIGLPVGPIDSFLPKPDLGCTFM
jgi:hypothetical protein